MRIPLNSLEGISLLRKEKLRVPILAILAGYSGMSEDVALSAARKIGATAVLAKNALGNAFYPAKLGDGFFTTQPVQHNADLFFSRILLARCPADILNCLGSSRLSCLRFLFHLHSPSGHYDEPETLSYAMPLVCPIGVDVRQCRIRKLYQFYHFTTSLS